MQPKNPKRMIKTGLISGILAAICCFTPVLVLLLSALGLAALTGYLDYVLLPVMAISLGLIVYAWRMKSG